MIENGHRHVGFFTARQTRRPIGNSRPREQRSRDSELPAVTVAQMLGVFRRRPIASVRSPSHPSAVTQAGRITAPNGEPSVTKNRIRGCARSIAYRSISRAPSAGQHSTSRTSSQSARARSNSTKTAVTVRRDDRRTTGCAEPPAAQRPAAPNHRLRRTTGCPNHRLRKAEAVQVGTSRCRGGHGVSRRPPRRLSWLSFVLGRFDRFE